MIAQQHQPCGVTPAETTIVPNADLIQDLSPQHHRNMTDHNLNIKIVASTRHTRRVVSCTGLPKPNDFEMKPPHSYANKEKPLYASHLPWRGTLGTEFKQ